LGFHLKPNNCKFFDYGKINYGKYPWLLVVFSIYSKGGVEQMRKKERVGNGKGGNPFGQIEQNC